MANQKKRNSGTVSNSPLPLAIVAVFGLAAGLTLMVADHTPRMRSGNDRGTAFAARLRNRSYALLL